MARTTQHAHQHDRQRHHNREGFTRRDVRHKQRMNAARKTSQRARDAKRHQLVAKRRHAHHFGGIFIVMNGKQTDAEFGGLNAVGNNQRSHRRHQRHQVHR